MDVGLAMEAVVRELREDADGAAAFVESRAHWYVPGASSSTDAARGVVRMVRAKIDELAGPLRAAVLRGELDPLRWQAIADAQEELLRANVGYLDGSNGFAPFFDQVVKASALELADDVKEAAGAALAWGPWVLAGAAVLAGLWLVRPLLVAGARA